MLARTPLPIPLLVAALLLGLLAAPLSGAHAQATDAGELPLRLWNEGKRTEASVALAQALRANPRWNHGLFLRAAFRTGLADGLAPPEAVEQLAGAERDLVAYLDFDPDSSRKTQVLATIETLRRRVTDLLATAGTPPAQTDAELETAAKLAWTDLTANLREAAHSSGRQEALREQFRRRFSTLPHWTARLTAAATMVPSGPVATQAAAPPPPPRPAQCPASGVLTLGVGFVIHEMDATTETFALYHYLVAHPPAPKATCVKRVEVRLIQDPAEADYAVLGSIDQYALSHEYTGASWPHTYSVTQRATLTLLRGGAASAAPLVALVPRNTQSYPTEQSRDQLNQPLWKAIAAKVADAIDHDLAHAEGAR